MYISPPLTEGKGFCGHHSHIPPSHSMPIPLIKKRKKKFCLQSSLSSLMKSSTVVLHHQHHYMYMRMKQPKCIEEAMSLHHVFIVRIFYFFKFIFFDTFTTILVGRIFFYFSLFAYTHAHIRVTHLKKKKFHQSSSLPHFFGTLSVSSTQRAQQRH